MDLPTPKDLAELLDWVHEGLDGGSHYPGMSYEEGIRDIIDWLEGRGSRPDKDE
jgi:hypothetical protein